MSNKCFILVSSMEHGRPTYQTFSFLELVRSGKSAPDEKKCVNYYPFGLQQKGYNGNVISAENNYKTYQGQEFTEELDLNIHEWKYRISDPAIGRFWQIDPLAEKFYYNSPYAFQENKLGSGIELEGLENVGWEFLKNLWSSTKVNSVSLSLGTGFKISNTGATASVAKFDYNIEKNTFSFTAIDAFIGVGDSDDAVKAKIDIAYSSKNFDNDNGKGGFIRVEGKVVDQGNTKGGSVALFAKNAEGEKGVLLTQSSDSKNNKKDASNYSTPNTDTNFKFKLGIGIDFSIDWNKFNVLQKESKNESNK